MPEILLDHIRRRFYVRSLSRLERRFYAIEHAPKGGANAGGKEYRGGEFVPGNASASGDGGSTGISGAGVQAGRRAEAEKRRQALIQRIKEENWRETHPAGEVADEATIKARAEEEMRAAEPHFQAARETVEDVSRMPPPQDLGREDLRSLWEDMKDYQKGRGEHLDKDRVMQGQFAMAQFAADKARKPQFLVFHPRTHGPWIQDAKGIETFERVHQLPLPVLKEFQPRVKPPGRQPLRAEENALARLQVPEEF